MGKRWALGVDAGERSTGLAAVEIDRNGTPISLLAATSVIHDGGIGNEKTHTSRLAERGMARRTRRARHRRRARLNALDKLLRENGFPSGPNQGIRNSQTWRARALLVEGYVEDAAERKRLVGLAVGHIARHTGWRNPWLSFESLSRMAKEAPSSEFCTRLESVRAEHGIELSIKTPGQLAWKGIARGLEVNPSGKPDYKQERTGSTQPVLGQRLRQEDTLHELRLILSKQKVAPELQEQIERVVFERTQAAVPLERVGLDPYDRTARAPQASREFQRFRIFQDVANLRLRERSGAARALDDDERWRVTNYLLACRERPFWWQIAAEVLDVDAADLVCPGERGASGKAPIDATTSLLYSLAEQEKLTTVLRLLDEAADDEIDAFVSFLIDSTGTSEYEMPEWLSEDEVSVLAETRFEAGRAAYGYETLSQLAPLLQSGMDVTTALAQLYPKGPLLRPGDPLAEPTGHPVVDRNLSAMRKFVSSATARWGRPVYAVVEIARPVGPPANEDERARNRRLAHESANAAAAALVRRELGLAENAPVSKRDIRKWQLRELHLGGCLYCGRKVSWSECEVDHIVPRADGGANAFSNLAPACQACNREKNASPYGAWAKTSGRTDADAVRKRVEALERRSSSYFADDQDFAAYKRELLVRLGRTSREESEPLRSISATGYAASEMRRRLEAFLGKPEAVRVFSGAVTSEVRSVLGADPRDLLGRPKENTTKRIDRRHHAIDAALLTIIDQRASELLAGRHVLRRAVAFDGGADGSARRLSAFEEEIAGRPEWLRFVERGHALVGLLEAAAQADRIAVLRPLRLRGGGNLHGQQPDGEKGTKGKKVVFKSLTESWTREEILAVGDNRVAAALLAELGEGAAIPARAERRVPRWTSGRPVPRTASGSRAILAVHNGAADMGGVHHLRLFAWKSGAGVTFGMVRVYLSDLGDIARAAGGSADPLTAPLPAWCASMRSASTTVRKKIAAGEAKEIAWLAPGDEIVFAGPPPITAMCVPERRWYLSGTESDLMVTLRPLYLAAEGFGDVASDKALKRMFRGGARASVSVLFATEGVEVVRRTALGAPRRLAQREDGRGHRLPLCFAPLALAKEALGLPSETGAGVAA